MRNIQTKTKKFSLWISDEEVKHLKKQSQNAGINQAELIRRLVMQQEIRPRNCEHHTKMLHFISGLCNNANQLAYKANSTGVARQEDVEQMTKLANEIYRLVLAKW